MAATQRCTWLALLIVLLAVLALAVRPAVALELEITDGSNTITIVDDGTGDLNLVDPKVIDFDITTDPTIPDLDGGGRVRQVATALGQVLTLSATPPNLATTLKNNGAGALAITITIRSDDPYPAAIGAPLGWRLFYNGEVADPTPANNADVTGHTAELFKNNEVTALVTGIVPNINLLGDPPISFDANPAPGSDLVASATSSQLVATFTIGAGDEMRLPENPDTEGNGLQGAVFNHDGKCISLMNKNAAKVVQAEQKGDSTCVRDITPAGGDVTACVDGIDTKGETAETKLIDQFVDFQCDPAAAWGVNADTCCDGGASDGASCGSPLDCGGSPCTAGACISGAAQRTANDAMHELFGASVVIGAGDVGACQERVVKQAIKAIPKAWKQLSSCKKKSFNSILNDTDLNTVCFAPLALNPTFLKVEVKIAAQADKCEASGVVPAAAQFPGACGAAPNTGAFGTCVISRVRCVFCQGVQVADDIDPGAISCDLFDDNLENSSCSDLPGATTTTTTSTTL